MKGKRIFITGATNQRHRPRRGGSPGGRRRQRHRRLQFDTRQDCRGTNQVQGRQRRNRRLWIVGIKLE